MEINEYVKVTWRDSQTQGGWLLDREIIAGPCTVKTVGWLYSEDDDRIIIGQSYIEKLDQIGEMIAIPKSAIVSMERRTWD